MAEHLVVNECRREPGAPPPHHGIKGEPGQGQLSLWHLGHEYARFQGICAKAVWSEGGPRQLNEIHAQLSYRGLRRGLTINLIINGIIVKQTKQGFQLAKTIKLEIHKKKSAQSD